MNLTPKNNIDEFNRILFEDINLDIYEHKFLNDYIRKAVLGLAPLSDLSIINISSKGWLLILHGEMLLVYGDNWNENQIQEIREIFDLNKFTNFTLAGDNTIIDKLIEFYKPKNFHVVKRRLLYKTSQINRFNNQDFKIQLGTFKQLNELSVMLQNYYHEEYNGLNEKTIKDMRQQMMALIKAKQIYVLLDMTDTLLSFCTIIDPDVGILFTKHEYRNKGYGKIILSHCSAILNQKNKTVYVMTDRDKIESNIVCEAVGFKPFFKYIATKINNS